MSSTSERPFFPLIWDRPLDVKGPPCRRDCGARKYVWVDALGLSWEICPRCDVGSM